MITIIDLKISNIASVSQALKLLEVNHNVSGDLEVIRRADKLIFPGVGNFAKAVRKMEKVGLDKVLKHRVLEEKTPILGICLGMQLFATYGEEGGPCRGLDFIKAKVSYLRSSQVNLRIPHVGWNDVNFSNMPIFDSLETKNCFYFVHSYEMVVQEPAKVAYCNYGVDFVAAVQKDNIVGVQFHPEKSQEAGLALLENFTKRM